MAQSEVIVIIKGDDKISASLKKIGGNFANLGDKTKGLGSSFMNLGSSVLGLGAKMTKVAAGGLAAFGAGLGVIAGTSIKVASEFEESMKILGVAASSSATSLDDLHAAALAVGSDTSLVGVSASEAAEAMTGLYKAGLDTTDIFGDLNSYLDDTEGLSGALRAAVDLQAASELDLAQASDLVAIAMASFGLAAEDATAITDNFVQAADASVADVGDLAEALKNVGPTAAAFGFSLEETNNALAILSTRGISGAEAGNALKSMLTNIQRPTNKVQDAMMALGVELFDTEGNMKSLEAIVGEFDRALGDSAETIVTVGGLNEEQSKTLEKLRKKYNSTLTSIDEYQKGIKGAALSEEKRTEKIAALNTQLSAISQEMTGLEAIQAQATTTTRKLTQEEKQRNVQIIAGTYGMKALQTLLAEGEEGWKGMIDATQSAATASEVAGARTNTLKGALEALRGTFETLQIGIGEAFLPVLTKLARKLAEFINDKGPAIKQAFDNLALAVDAFLSGTPQDFPWEDILPPGLADIMYKISAGFEAVIQSVRLLAGEIAAGGGVDLSVLQEIWSNVLPEGIVAKIIKGIQVVVDNWETFKTVILAVGAVLAGAAIAAGIAAIAAALGTLLSPIGLIIAAVAGLAAAWQTNFMGIRDTVLPIVDKIATAIGDFIPKAIAALQSVWDNVLLPLFEKLKQIWEVAVQPAMAELFAAFKELGRAISEAWAVMAPIIEEIIKAFVKGFGMEGGSGGKVILEFKDIVMVAVAVIVAGLKGLALWVQFAAKILTKAFEVVGVIWERDGERIVKVVTKIGVYVRRMVKEVTRPLRVFVDLFEIAFKVIAKIVKKFIGGSIIPDMINDGMKDILKIFSKIWKKIEKFIDKVLSSIADIIESVLEDIARFIERIMDEIRKTIEKVWDAIERFIDKVMASIERIIDRGWEAIKTLIDQALNEIKIIIEKVWESIKSTIYKVMDDIKRLLERVWNDIKSKIDSIMDDIKRILEGAWEEIKSKIDSVMDDIKRLLERAWNEIKSKVETVMDDIQRALETAWNEIKSKVETVMDDIQRALETAWNNIKSYIDGVMSDIKNLIETAWEDIKRKVDDLLDDIERIISDTWDNIKSTINSYMDDIRTRIETGWENIKNAIMTKVEEIKNAIAEKFQEIYDVVKTKLEELTNIPTQISDLLLSIGTKIVDYIKQGIESVTSFVTNVLEIIRGWMQNVWNSIVASFDQAKWVGGEIVNKIIEGIRSVWTFVNDVLDWLGEQISSIASSLAGGVSSAARAAIDIGKELVERIVEGIKGMTGAVWDAIARVLNDALDAIGLPRLFPEPDANFVGESLVTSIADGIYSSAFLVADAAVSAVEEAYRAAESVLSSNTLMVNPIPITPDLSQPPSIGSGTTDTIESASTLTTATKTLGGVTFNTVVTDKISQEEFNYRTLEALRQLEGT